MTEELVSLIREIAANKDLAEYDEAKTQNGIILPVLRELGWRVFDTKEVIPQYPVGTGRVDYALIPSPEKRVLCEVKAPSETDLSKHEDQLIGYAYKKGAEIALLTNGLEWWLYLPMLPIDWRERRFCTVDLRAPLVKDSAANLEQFLGKENIRTGEAQRMAMGALQSHKVQEEIETALPSAWAELVNGPDERLLDLLCKQVEKMCCHKPTVDQAKEFMMNWGYTPPVVKESPKKKPCVLPLELSPKEQRLNEKLATLKTNTDVESFLKEVQAEGCAIYTRFIGREAIEFTATQGAKRPCVDYVKVRGNGRRAGGECYVDIMHRYLVVRIKPKTGNPYYRPSKKTSADE